MAPDHRKPPKQAQLPDVIERPRTYASKLVAGPGVSGSSPLVGFSFCCDLQEKHKSGSTSPSLNYSNRTATRAWQGGANLAALIHLLIPSQMNSPSILRPQAYIAYLLGSMEFSGVRGLVLLWRGLGALFEGAVHLLEPALRVGLKATGKQRDEQTLEHF